MFNGVLPALLIIVIVQYTTASDDINYSTMMPLELNLFVQDHEYVLAYYAPTDCETCEEQEKIVKDIIGSSYISTLYGVRILSYPSFINKPSLIFFRKAMPMLYPSPLIEKNDVIIWLEQHKNVVMRILTDDNFEHLTQASTGATTGDWLISFELSGCDQLTPLMEAVAHHERQKINVATVDLTRQLELKKRFQIEGCPSIYLFRHGNMYAYTLKEFTFQSLTEFAENTYKHSKAEKVPNPQSPFDKLVEYVVDRLKKSSILFYTLIGIPIVLILIAIYTVRKRRLDQKRFKLH